MAASLTATAAGGRGKPLADVGEEPPAEVRVAVDAAQRGGASTPLQRGYGTTSRCSRHAGRPTRPSRTECFACAEEIVMMATTGTMEVVPVEVAHLSHKVYLAQWLVC